VSSTEGVVVSDEQVRKVVALTQRWRQRRTFEAAVWDMLLGAEDFGIVRGGTDPAAEWSPAEIVQELERVLVDYRRMAAEARAATDAAPLPDGMARGPVAS
jgi:hypothetical protein